MSETRQPKAFKRFIGVIVLIVAVVLFSQVPLSNLLALVLIPAILLIALIVAFFKGQWSILGGAIWRCILAIVVFVCSPLILGLFK